MELIKIREHIAAKRIQREWKKHIARKGKGVNMMKPNLVFKTKRKTAPV